MEEIMEFLSANWIYVGAASLVIIIIIIGIVAGTNKKNKKKANPDMISVSDNQNSDVQMGVAANAAASLEPVNSMEQKPLEVAEESSMPVSNEDFNPYAVNQPTDNQSMEPSTMSMPVEEPMMNTPVEEPTAMPVEEPMMNTPIEPVINIPVVEPIAQNTTEIPVQEPVLDQSLANNEESIQEPLNNTSFEEPAVNKTEQSIDVIDF